MSRESCEREAEELMMAMTFKPIEELRERNHGHIKLIAEALKTARNQALDEATKIADSFKAGEHDPYKHHCNSCDSSCYDLDLCGCCGNNSEQIAQAISALKEKEGA